MKVLVTGATGFVGGAVVSSLARERRWTPVAASRRHALLPDGAELAITPSLGADADWSDALQGVEGVVHAAARVHVMDEEAADPLAEYRHTNVEGTLALAWQAAQAGVRRFVFVSSIKVNGEQTSPHCAFTAEDAPAPVDPYGVSKAEAEAGLFALARETGMEVVVVRPPLVYGPGAGGNFARMARWVGKGVPLPLGALDNRRSLVGLDNLVDLLVTCLEHPAAANRVFLAGDGEDLSTTGLLRRVAAAMGRRARLVPVPPALLRAGARAVGRAEIATRLLDSLQVDITHTRQTLSWEPPVSVDEGLRRAVAPSRG
ncbi:NAD-dependent epimerase/dehydratase family protein [Thioalkalivibrio sp. ALJ3]|uniref:NAD-dependent epimerase/dehydratase family protein n=1 Tax=Thioalkalivibrio sp. ALJ3 TaxID=1240557 RepID=UPI00037EDB08|nr:NAD-dependent epimerase/dehydratase family protein [Thioalkalivibrio sp. ALJ3]